jgi:hypothetical protein
MSRTTSIAAMFLGATVLAWAGGATAHEGEEGHEGHASEQANTSGVMHSHEQCRLHDGQVSMTKQHHFETVFAPDGIRVYVYTEGQTPMMVDAAKGSATLKFKDGRTLVVPFLTDVPKEGEKTVYFCPMHPTVVQMEPGVCKLCGTMKLFTQDRLYAKVDLSKVPPGTVEAVIQIAGLEGTEKQVKFTEAYGGVPVAGEGAKTGTQPQSAPAGDKAH